MADFPHFRRTRSQAGTITSGAGARVRGFEALGRLLALINIWFWAIVGIPSLGSAVYFFGIASNQYQSEVEFIVRAPERQNTPNLGSLLSGSSAVGGIENTYAVRDFILSRDAVYKLEETVDLREILGRPEGDVLSRFPGILALGRHDFEALYKAYRRFVSVEIDTTSGAATVEVTAYRPEDAEKIAKALLHYSEQLVNSMNDRARRDALTVFEAKISEIRERIEKTQAELTAYRIKQNMIDPKSAATGPLELLANLIRQQTAARTQLTDMLKNAPHNPQIGLLQTRIGSLEKQIEELRSKITGGDNSVATAMANYDKLTVDLGLDEKALASAFTSLEAARLEAQQKQLYLEAIIQPRSADFPIYPRRFVWFTVFTVSCLLVYSICWLLIAAVRDHSAA